MTKQELLNELMRKKKNLEQEIEIRAEKVRIQECENEEHSKELDAEALLHIGTIKKVVSFLSYGE